MIDINISLIIQLFNFLALYWLLDLLLFKPLLRVMDERRSRFNDLAEGFATEKGEIEQLESSYQSRLAEINSKAAAMRRQARDDAEAEKGVILKKAEQTARVMTGDKLKVVEQNLKELEAELGKSRSDLVEALNRKVLGL